MRLLAVLAVALALSGCVSTTQNIPNPTATEEMLTSHALREAVRGLNLRLPVGSKVFLDVSAVRDPSAALMIRQHFEGQHIALVDRSTAVIVVEVALPVLGIDDLNRVLGLPATSVPSLHAGMPEVAIPEVAIWSRHERSGVAELHATAVDLRTGCLVSAVGPLFGVARIVNTHLLSGLVFGDELAPPQVVAVHR